MHVPLPLEGGCRCGAVRIRATAPPIATFACHCPGCQKMASSAFSLTAIFPRSGFSVTKGATVIGGMKSPDLQHHFCASCLTWMFTEPKALPDMVNVRPSMFDDPSWFKPFAETFTKTKLPFAETGAKRSFEEFPPMDAYEGLMRDFATWA